LGGQVFCANGELSVLGLTFSLSSSGTGPTPTEGGGPGVGFDARYAGVLIIKPEDMPKGWRYAPGVSGACGGGAAGVRETIGVFCTLKLMFFLGVWPGMLDKSTVYLKSLSSRRRFSRSQLKVELVLSYSISLEQLTPGASLYSHSELPHCLQQPFPMFGRHRS
jgi:hypothetical protein